MDINQYLIQTPEGISLNLQLAGLWTRAAAWLIDFIIRLAIFFVLAILLSFFGAFGGGIMLLTGFILEWFYPVIFEVLFDGMTPGKRRMGIQVVCTNGTTPGWKTSFIRNLLRVVDILPAFYGVGLFSLLITKNNQRIGDLAAETLVIYNNRLSHPETISFSSEQTTTTAGPANLGTLIQSLERDEKNAIISFSERYQDLSSERRQELCNVLSPVLQQYQLSATPENVVTLANRILGSA